MRHMTIVVTGKVQGVFFRASTKEIADQLGIKGFVKNQPDGSVYIEAEGEKETLRQFIAWCHQGPPRAVVSNVQVSESELQNFERFEIRR